MKPYDWAPLRHALARCRQHNVAVPFWWRDDDAIEATAALNTLTELSSRTGVSVHLAIIPANIDPHLPDTIDTSRILPVVHGWAHADHSLPGEKKNEFLTPRTGAVQETRMAFAKMQDLFGARLCKMFVPPWNRISHEVALTLETQGYGALSTYGARPQSCLGGLEIINTHVDPIWWKGDRGLMDSGALIASAANHLLARADGIEDRNEPFGLLTHHLVHTPAVWSFAEAFLNEMLAGGATLWTMENDDE